MTEDEFETIRGSKSIMRVNIFPGFCMVLSSSIFNIMDGDSDGYVRIRYNTDSKIKPAVTRFKLICKFNRDEIKLIDEAKLANFAAQRIEQSVNDLSPSFNFKVVGITFKDILGFSNTHYILEGVA